jgi:hypothetical protein
MLGIAHRMADALVFILQTQRLHRILAVYAFDLARSPLRSSNAGYITFMTRIDLGWSALNLMTS